MSSSPLYHFILRVEQAAYRYLEITETTMEVLIAAIIGLLAGTLGVTLRAVVNDIERWREHVSTQTAFWLVFPLVSAGLLIILYRWIRKEISGYTFPEYLVNVNLKAGHVPKRTIPGRFVATLLSIGGGASVGLEGPAAVLGGAVGSAFSRSLRASADQTKTFIACGTAAGVASLFNAPLAGVFFALEIVLLGAFNLSGVILVVISSGTGVAVSRGWVGDTPLYITQAVEQFEVHSTIELASFAFLGIAIGVGAVVFIRGFHGVRQACEQIPLAWYWQLGVGGGGLIVLAVLVPHLLGSGDMVIRGILDGNTYSHGLLALVLLSVGKAVASGWSLGTGYSGGMFGPCIYSGVTLGAAVGLLLQQIAPVVVGPEAVSHYALVGMGAMVAAVNHAPLTGIFLLFEITDSYQVILPIMFASVIATFLTRLIEDDSLDTYTLSRRGIELHQGKESIHLCSIPIEKVIRRSIAKVHLGTSLEEVYRMMQERNQLILPVVDAENRLAGVVVGEDLAELLSDPELGMVLIVQDMMRVAVQPVYHDRNVGEALRLLNRSHLAGLPVVDAENRVVGMIYRDDISAAYDKTILIGMLESLSPQEEPQ